MRDRIDFVLVDDGGVLWLAPMNLGGESYQAQIVNHINAQFEGGETMMALVEQGLDIPVGFYGEGGYVPIRVVIGNCTASESEGWTARITSKLDLSCGQLIVSCLADPDAFYDDPLPQPVNVRALEPAIAKLGESPHCGDIVYVDVPPGEYWVDVYSYPPKDLSGNWESIVNPDYWDAKHPEAESLDHYWRRTRADQEPPVWIVGKIGGNDGVEEWNQVHAHIALLIQLAPLQEVLPSPEFSEDGCTLKWQTRKPETCPIGLLMHIDAPMT